MSKKKLPRAIRPSGADTVEAVPAPGASAAPLRHDPVVRSKTVATEERAERRKNASIMTKETASPETTESSPEGRRASAVKLVERFSLWSGAAGLIPVPLVDLAAVGGVQIQMLRRISQIYNVPFSENRGKALIASLAGSMIPASSVLGTTSIIKGVPVVGTVVCAIAMPALSAGATYAIGMAFIEHFASGGTLLDFNPPDYREFIKAQRDLRSIRSTASHI
jgi:uncharacterized protein (DUF697 family)